MTQLLNEIKIRPMVDDKIAVDLVERLYGFKVKSIQELNSYDDKNYRIICDDDYDNDYVEKISENGYVLKIMNSLDSKKKNLIEGQNAMMLYLNQHNVICPVPVHNVKGLYYSSEKISNESDTIHIVRLLVYCPGEVLYNANLSTQLLFNVGNFAANLDNTLKDFVDSAYENHVQIWNLLAVPQLRDYTFVIANDKDKSLVIDVINSFEIVIVKNIDKLEKGMIHGDLNEQNILVDDEQTNIVGVIDFGDSQYSYQIFELMITIFYMITQARDIEMGKYVIAGYQNVRKLSKFEKKILKVGVCARACQSLVFGIYSHLNEPNNDYLIITQKTGWKILRELWAKTDEEISSIWEL